MRCRYLGVGAGQYQGAPTPITAFMAAAAKIAAFGALIRLSTSGFRNSGPVAVLWAVAILTMAVGTIAR